jgi:NAD(P)H dehydrogenase (quinone)
MKVLTVYAHHDPNSFCHAILDRFSAGLSEAGHTNEVIDLHAIRFDPVLRSHDRPNWIDDSVPDDVLANLKIEQSFLKSAGPLKRLLVRRWVSGRDARGIIRKLRDMGGPGMLQPSRRRWRKLTPWFSSRLSIFWDFPPFSRAGSNGFSRWASRSG